MSNRAQPRSYSKMEAILDLLKAVAIFGVPGRAEGSVLIKVLLADTRDELVESPIGQCRRLLGIKGLRYQWPIHS
jgi:hypothetical protein